MKHVFNSSYSWQMTVATVCVLTLIVYGIYAIIIKILTLPANSYTFIAGACAIIALVGVTVCAFANQIMEVSIDDHEVVIKKMIGKIVISRDKITRVTQQRHHNWDIRIFGISGLFGHIGWFWNSNKGSYHAYAKDGNATFLIETSKEKYLVSCDNCKQVVSILNGTEN